MPDRTELKRLVLQVARDREAQAGLRTLLNAADALILAHRNELRAVKARLKRRGLPHTL